MYLAAEVFAAFIGGIEAEMIVGGAGGQEVVDERAAIGAESGAVVDDAFGIYADESHFKVKSEE